MVDLYNSEPGRASPSKVGELFETVAERRKETTEVSVFRGPDGSYGIHSDEYGVSVLGYRLEDGDLRLPRRFDARVVETTSLDDEIEPVGEAVVLSRLVRDMVWQRAEDNRGVPRQLLRVPFEEA